MSKKQMVLDSAFAAEEIMKAKQIAETIPGFKVPNWFREEVTKAAGLIREGKNMDAARAFDTIFRSFRIAVGKFFSNSPDFFIGKIDEVKARTELDEDLENRLTKKFEALKATIVVEQGEVFEQRLVAYKDLFVAVSQVPLEQRERDRKRAEKAREEAKRKQEEEAARQREIQRQKNEKAADEILAALG